MLEAARKKKVYANLICDFLTEKKLDIEEGIYSVYGNMYIHLFIHAIK